jgi:hypothetical protein
MNKFLILLPALAGCALRPGQSRCSTSHVFGTDITNCQVYVPPTPAPEPQEVQSSPRIHVTEQSADIEVNQTPNTVTHKIVTGSTLFYCSGSDCFQNAADCMAHVTKDSPCQPQEAVACFNYNDVLSGERRLQCTVSMKICDAELAGSQSDPDRNNVSTLCGVYRHTSDEDAFKSR